MKRFTADNFAGCLVGGAIGDALGYVIEFMESESIFKKYGDDGIKDFSQEEEVFISDDTQMTMFTANGLLYYATSGGPAGKSVNECLHEAYVDWLRSQNDGDEARPDESSVSWVLNIDEMRVRRAPGNTCLSALRSGAHGTMEEPLNNSKGCGGIMRVAPIGLFVKEPLMAARIAAESAALTHGNPLGFIPSAAYAYIINRLVYTDEDFADIISGCVKMMISEFSYYTETVRVIELLTEAVELALSEEPASANESEYEHFGATAKKAEDAALYDKPVVLAPPAKKYGNIDMKAEAARLEKLGGGWVAEETLAIAVYCCLRFGDDFETAVRVAANHSGDSDSTASLTGAIIGAAIGNSNMPTKYVMLLELYDVLMELSQDLYDGCQASETVITADDEIWREKYVDHVYA